MIFQVFAVKDEMTNRFMEPQFARTDIEMTRIFTMQINDIKLWKDNSADYSLYKIGEYDEEKGFINNDIIKIIGGRSVRKEENG